MSKWWKTGGADEAERLLHARLIRSASSGMGSNCTISIAMLCAHDAR